MIINNYKIQDYLEIIFNNLQKQINKKTLIIEQVLYIRKRDFKSHHLQAEIQIYNNQIRSEIHFHCGSGSSSSFSKVIDLSRECIKIGREYGHIMYKLDVGGGSTTGNLQQNILNACEKTNDDPLGYQVIAEPGRYFSANCCYLMFRVKAKRNKQEQLRHHVNDSYYHSFNCLLTDGVTFKNYTDQFYGISTSDQIIAELEKNVSIFGMTCDGADIIAKNITLPSNMLCIVVWEVILFVLNPNLIALIKQKNGHLKQKNKVKNNNIHIENKKIKYKQSFPLYFSKLTSYKVL